MLAKNRLSIDLNDPNNTRTPTMPVSPEARAAGYSAAIEPDLNVALKKFSAVAVALGLKADAPAAEVVAAWDALLESFPQPSASQMALALSAEERQRCAEYGVKPEDYAVGKALRAVGII